MRLIRRKKQPTPAQKALDYAKLGVRGLVAVRVLRNSFKHYKRARRLPLILGGGAIVAILAKLLGGRGGSEQPAAQTWTPPASSAPPAPKPAASTPAPVAPTPTPAPTPSNGAPNPVETAATGTPEPTQAPEPPATGDGPELAPEGGDIAPGLEASEKPSSPS